MYLVRSLRTFIGTNAERIAAGLAAFLAGDEYIEVDDSGVPTGFEYIHTGMAWLENSGGGASDVDDLTTATGSSGEMVRVAAAGGLEYRTISETRTDLGLVAGGAGDIWVEKAGDSMTGSLSIVKSTATATDDFLILDQDSTGGAYLRFNAGALSARVGLNQASSEFVVGVSATPTVFQGPSATVSINTHVAFDPGGYESVIFQGSGSDPAAIFNNPNWADYHFQVKTENNDYMVYVNSGTDSFNIGTSSEGTIAQFSNAGIVFNDEEADRNFRIAGNGVTNGYFYDAGLNRHGFGTGTPSVKVHVVETSGTVAIFEENASGEVGINSFYNPNTTDNNGALIRFDTDTTGTGATARSQIAQIGVVFTVHDHSTRTGNIVFRNYQSGAFGTRATIGLGVQIGAPTGGDKGAGTINVATNIYKNNTAYTNPDYALEHWATGEIKQFANRDGAQNYYRLSLDESEKFVRKNLHLPRISRDSAGIFDMADMALEKIEEAHIYIYELHNRIKVLEQRLLA